MRDQVRQILANFSAPRGQILEALTDLERAEAAACCEIDALRERRARLLLDGSDSDVDVVDQAIAAATRRLERVEAQQAALHERLEGRPAGGATAGVSSCR